MTTTFRFFMTAPAKAIGEWRRVLPNATPAAERRKSRRVKASWCAISWGVEADEARREARPKALCVERKFMAKPAATTGLEGMSRVARSQLWRRGVPFWDSRREFVGSCLLTFA